MRTRSEWFLGPRDAVVSLQLPADTCSNCCLAAAAAAAAGYLGGGSTRDMRQTVAGVGGIGGSATAMDAERNSAALLFHFYRRQQRECELEMERERQHHLDDLMDTEDSYSCCRQQQQQQQQHIHSKGLLRPPQQQQQRRLLLDVNSVGNIRLSNSAESIQYATRRPNISSIGSNPNSCSVNSSNNPNSNTRRLLINVPRQYPLRSSLRRHKEKQIGGSQSNSSNSISNEQLTGNVAGGCGTAATVAAAPLNKPLLLVGLLPGAEQPPSVRNSIADCGSIDYDKMDTMEHQLSLECSTTLSFKPPRL
ncbi:hypothetical protein ACLKA6_013100 [Drosophila palustris]